MIRTKIVATIGPASAEVDVLRRLAQAGVDVFRVNFSHGREQDRERFLANIRQVEESLGRPLAVMADLCGPKIRVGHIAAGEVELQAGARIVIQRDPVEGTAQRISTTLAELVDSVKVGERILLDDGKLCLRVESRNPPREFTCTVVRGGKLSSGKGVNLPHTALKLSALTEKDRRDVRWICKRSFDYVALSFVRSAQDVLELRKLLAKGRSGAQIVAKVEKPQALEQIEEIVAAADVVMVARGDLGVEMDLPAVPVAQKRIARLCQQAGKPCIVATQMLETMTASPVPTRAEVSDVANAVLDHADAVMLSGETAVGKYPVEAVTVMNEIVDQIQAYHDEAAECAPPAPEGDKTVAALAVAAKEIARMEQIAAVAVYTATGSTARLLAKNRLCRPILAMSPDVATVRRMCMYYGVEPVQASSPEHTRDILDQASRHALRCKLAAKGDKLIVISGRPIGKPGHTNTLVVHTIGQRS